MAVNNFDYQVSWSDFIKVSGRPSGVNEDAEIVLRFKPDYEYSISGKAVTITTVSVDMTMASPECWVVSSETTNMYLLKHEQGHFDITALGAREFNNRLDKLSATSEDELKKKVKKIQEEIQKKINTANSNYDDKTNHSINTQVQKTWDQKIDTVKKNPKGKIDDLP